MSAEQAGGSAFPVQHQEDANGNVRTWGEMGMTLRDYFAAKAMQALLQEVAAARDHAQVDKIAPSAYQMADAMLKARVS